MAPIYVDLTIFDKKIFLFFACVKRLTIFV